LAEFVDVAEEGGVDGVGDEDYYGGGPGGFEVEGDEAFCVTGLLSQWRGSYGVMDGGLK